MSFSNEKSVCLSKFDKSQKGSLDKQVLELVGVVNKNQHYYTTSSCSGRVVLRTAGRKSESKLLFMSHDLVDIDYFLKVVELLDESVDEVWFRMESMIVHIACDSLENAQKLVDFARNNGFRRAGIQSTNKKYLVEIVGSEVIYCLLAKEGKLLVSEEYIRELVKNANEKMEINWNKIKKIIEFF